MIDPLNLPPAKGLDAVHPSTGPNPASSKQVRKRGISFVEVHRTCDRTTEVLIYFMVVFTPWAFGTTQPWSIKVMNITGYVLGILLLTKLVIRWRADVFVNLFGHEMPSGQLAIRRAGFRGGHAITIALALLTVVVLAYCLTSALNARSTYHLDQLSFEYREYIRWLPHSYDRHNTWIAFWNFLALAFTFWAIRDWLLGQEETEIYLEPKRGASAARRAVFLPVRLRRLLWLVSLNASLLALEGIFQRADATGKLLWIVEPRVNKNADSQFGPYAYRANAAQFFNLVWPVTLGFWWMLRRAALYRKRQSTVHNLLLACVMLMAVCPLISLSRGGAAVAVGILLASAILLLIVEWHAGWLHKFGMLLFFCVTLILAGYVGWSKLARRFTEMASDPLAGRARPYEIAHRIARDFPLFGTGPNTFDPVFQLYRESIDEYWPAQLHNDWLETLVTFGWLGFSLILGAFVLVFCRWFFPDGIAAHWLFTAFIWLALAGCLAHARFDFPFQIYSILFLFLLFCSILFSTTRSPV